MQLRAPYRRLLFFQRQVSSDKDEITGRGSHQTTRCVLLLLGVATHPAVWSSYPYYTFSSLKFFCYWASLSLIITKFTRIFRRSASLFQSLSQALTAGLAFLRRDSGEDNSSPHLDDPSCRPALSCWCGDVPDTSTHRVSPRHLFQR